MSKNLLNCAKDQKVLKIEFLFLFLFIDLLIRNNKDVHKV